MAESANSRSRVWSNLLICVATLLICSLLIETSLRLGLIGEIPRSPRYMAEARYGEYTLRRLRPNTTFWHSSADGSWKYITNAQGFRDERQWSYQKPFGEFRILVLGDSHTQGYEVAQHETYARVLERYLRLRHVDARAFNTGISGFGTSEQMLFLENEGIKYSPDVVILGFFQNDFFDNVKAGLFTLVDGNLEPKKKTHIPGVSVLEIHNDIAPLRWLSENSLFYSLLMNTGWRAAKSALSRQSAEDLGMDFAIVKEAPSQYMVDLTIRLLQRLHEVCQKQAIPLIILEIPQPGKNGQFRPSVPENLIPAFRMNSEVFLSAEEVLGVYRGLTQTHAPNGSHHINALSHLMLGIAAGEAIMRLNSPGLVQRARERL